MGKIVWADGNVQISSTLFSTDPKSPKGPSRFSGPTSPPALWNYSKASIASLMGKLYESLAMSKTRIAWAGRNETSLETLGMAPWTMHGALREHGGNAASEPASSLARTAWELRPRRRHAHWETLGSHAPGHARRSSNLLRRPWTGERGSKAACSPRPGFFSKSLLLYRAIRESSTRHSAKKLGRGDQAAL